MNLSLTAHALSSEAEMRKAIEALYFAAYWTPDRECDAGRLWEQLRDAAEIPPGQAGMILGQPLTTLVEALRDAIEGYEECSQYKGDYLQEKHGDAEDIARLKAVLAEATK